MKIYGGVLKGSTFRDQSYVPTGLVEYLDAEDYSGTGTTWSARVGNSATLVNAPYWTADQGTYFTFVPASLQYAEAPTLGDLNTWTVECWYNMQADLSTQNDPALVTTEFQNDNGSVTYGKVNFTLMQQYQGGYTNTLEVGYYNGGFPGWVGTAPFTPTVGTWNQIIGTFDGSTVSCYLNNNLTSQTGGIGPSSANGGPLRIARRWDGTLSPEFLFPAHIAIVRIYNFAFSPDQVTRNFNSTRGRFGI